MLNTANMQIFQAGGCPLTPTTAATTSPNPQSFNRYSYVLNNPLSFTDPTGLDGGGVGGGLACAGEGAP